MCFPEKKVLQRGPDYCHEIYSCKSNNIIFSPQTNYIIKGSEKKETCFTSSIQHSAVSTSVMERHNQSLINFKG